MVIDFLLFLKLLNLRICSTTNLNSLYLGLKHSYHTPKTPTLSYTKQVY